MATSPSRLAFLKARLAECRANRPEASTEDASLPDVSDWELEHYELDSWRRIRSRLFNRKWLVGLTALIALGLVGHVALGWLSSPSKSDVNAGETLFTHVWTANDPLSNGGDGLGPVFNARSCVECHFQGGTGGGGALKHNVSAFEVLPTEGHPYPLADVVHKFALTDTEKETLKTARETFPIIPKGMTITAVCTQPLRKDYDPMIHHSINTPTLFGAGEIDRISDGVIRTNHLQRSISGMHKEFQGDFKATNSGRVRVLQDGRIGKFGWKAQFATLEEFVANACAVEIGLTTPTRKQHVPQHHCEDATATTDMNEQQFIQLVAFVNHLPAPRMSLPSDENERAEAVHGRELFLTIGCTDCHTPDLGGATGVFSDFCLHEITDRQSTGYIETPDVPVPEEYPRPAEWKTPPLWGVSQTAPYLHDGSAETLHAAIEAHAGQARNVREKYRSLPVPERNAIVRFLETLVVE